MPIDPTTEAPKNIPQDERLRLYVRAGGRCQLCNDYLLEDALTGLSVNLGEMAHNVGRKRVARSPRGSDDLPIDERNLAENLLLLCAKHHTVIDAQIAQGEFTVDDLRNIKAAQEERIRYLTSLGTDAETVVLRLVGDIRGTAIAIPDDEVRAAVGGHARRFPRSPLSYQGEGIDIDLGALPSTEGSPDYWADVRRQIDRIVGGKLRDGIERGEVLHLSVFGLARIPALVLLGDALDDKLSIDIYQRHRTGAAWSWDTQAEPVEFEQKTLQEGSDPSKVLLLLSISGSVEATDLPDDLVDGATIYEIRPVGVIPGRDILRSHYSLRAFEHCYHAFLSRLELERPAARSIDVFPAIPVSAAIAVGRGLMRDAQPSLRIFDRDGDTYSFAVDHGLLSSRGNRVEKGRWIHFSVADCDVPEPYDVYWKVRNSGEEADRVSELRGEIRKDTGTRTRIESTKYRGSHYVECYVVKDGKCVASDRQLVFVV